MAPYVQRDVRQLLNVTDLSRFTTFLRLCASRTAQELHLSSLGSDAGVSHNTANAWLSVLEFSLLCHRLPAWHKNLKKQVVKAPKLHFVDRGLVCYLLGIKAPEQLRHHPLRGAIFESWVFSELYKQKIHHGDSFNGIHFRESRGLKVDFIEVQAEGLFFTEAKSGETISSDSFKNLQTLEKWLSEHGVVERIHKGLVYGGNESQTRHGIHAMPWNPL